MAEVIQFKCPACGTMLRLPLALAAQKGPCPNCDREIIAPDPYRGIGAFEIPASPPPKEIEPFKPFSEFPPVLPKEPEVAPLKTSEPTNPVSESAGPPPVAMVQVPVCAKPQRAVLVLSCLVTGLVAGISGLVIGARSASSPVPPLVVTAPVVENPEPEPAPEPAPVVVRPMIEPPRIEEITKVEKKTEPATVSAAAEAALRAFLEAPDWAARNAYALFPDKVRSAMEAYSREVSDGPTPYQSIQVKQSHIDEKTGNTLFIFYVVTEKFPTGIPVAVKETAVGWLVDWLAFVEFRDGLFQKFVTGPVDKTGYFHLVVTLPQPERAANTENEHFSSFILQAPLDDKPQLAFVRKTSEAFPAFQNGTKDGGIFTPVLEVVKRKSSEGQSYFEVLSVKATDWLPREK